MEEQREAVMSWTAAGGKIIRICSQNSDIFAFGYRLCKMQMVGQILRLLAAYRLNVNLGVKLYFF